jgi:hypothetical protein
VVLDKLVGHEGFIQSSWKMGTYESVFKAYLKAFAHKSTPRASSDLSSQPTFHAMLENKDWVHYWFSDMFNIDTHAGGPHLPIMASQTANALRKRGVNDPRIKNAFDAFMNLSLVQRYATQSIFSDSEKDSQWPSHMQPLVRWMLEYVIDYGGLENSHPSIHTFATKLLERENFLSFICSSFLIEWNMLYVRPVALSEESFVLSRLAEYHKGKPGAVDAWRNVLDWVQHR